MDNFIKLVLLCGPPGSGKTTQAAIWKKKLNNPIYLSIDEFIERVARCKKSTYQEVATSKVYYRGKRRVKRLIEKAKKENRDVVWDQTSLLRREREIRFAMFPDYKHILVYAKKLSKEELIRRNEARPRGPMSVRRIVLPMASRYELPGEAERVNYDESYEF